MYSSRWRSNVDARIEFLGDHSVVIGADPAIAIAFIRPVGVGNHPRIEVIP